MSDSTQHAPQSFFRKYIWSHDHKVIGIQYLVTAIFMALVGGAMAMIFRIQLMDPTIQIVRPETYLSFVTMHGTIMVFFVMSLSLVSAFGNFLIPLHIGADDMAYPFLNALSYWTVVPACILMIISLFVPGGAAAAGWTAYPPLSAIPDYLPGSGIGQTIWLLAMALFIASATMGGLNYVVTILNCRAPGMSMMRMPMTVWTYLTSSVLAILAFPPLTAAAIMLLLDRHLGTSFFLPDGMVSGGEVLPHIGGTPLLFQHLFWFLGHPEVYVLVLPGVGMMFDVLATFTRRPPFGYKLSVYALGVIAFLSMIVWGHHMFVTGMNPWLGEYFSVSTVLISAPFAVLGVNLLGTLWRARIRLTIPMCFALAAVSAIGVGGLGGLFLGTSASDVYFHETYFVVGHFHLMIGTVTFLSLFAGIYYWFPKMFGRNLNTLMGYAHFWAFTIGMFGVFILMHFQGFGGMLRRTYDPTIYEHNALGATSLAMPISVLAFLVGASSLLFVFNFFWSACKGPVVTDPNPWKATTLEWTTTTPAPHGNWPSQPVVHRDAYGFVESGTSPDGEDFLVQSAPPTGTEAS